MSRVKGAPGAAFSVPSPVNLCYWAREGIPLKLESTLECKANLEPCDMHRQDIDGYRGAKAQEWKLQVGCRGCVPLGDHSAICTVLPEKQRQGKDIPERT